MTRVRERDENHDATKQQRHEGKEEKNNEDAIEQECTKKKNNRKRSISSVQISILFFGKHIGQAIRGRV